MALNRFRYQHSRQDGRPSFWERPSHALPDRKGDLPRGACILAKAYGFENYQIVRGHETADNFQMSNNWIRVTGCQLAAGRALASLSRQELAHRAGLSCHSIRDWERSSNSIPEATYDHLCRAIGVLEDAGIRFSDGGVYLQRTASPVSTVIESAGAAA